RTTSIVESRLITDRYLPPTSLTQVIFWLSQGRALAMVLPHTLQGRPDPRRAMERVPRQKRLPSARRARTDSRRDGLSSTGTAYHREAGPECRRTTHRGKKADWNTLMSPAGR